VCVFVSFFVLFFLENENEKPGVHPVQRTPSCFRRAHKQKYKTKKKLERKGESGFLFFF
jgi:hypothetical protein